MYAHKRKDNILKTIPARSELHVVGAQCQLEQDVQKRGQKKLRIKEIEMGEKSSYHSLFYLRALLPFHRLIFQQLVLPIVRQVFAEARGTRY
jgi:hypothetical protein